MQEQNLDLPVCPSFNSYSSDKLVDTAAKVCREFGNLGLESSDLDLHPQGSEFDGGDDFEFVSLFNAGDEVFVNGQMGQVFPVFNRDLLLDHNGGRDGKADGDDDDDEDGESVPGPPSSSSSEADELEGVPQGTYCVWTPKRVPESPGQCKKSKSTGSSSKRWRIRDLLRRCNSDGKDSYVFLTPLSSSKKMEADNKVENKLNKEKQSSGAGSGSSTGTGPGTGAVKGKTKGVEKAHEVFYLRNRKLKEVDKRRSFLPYRQGLVGFFANVNAMGGKTFPPF